MTSAPSRRLPLSGSKLWLGLAFFLLTAQTSCGTTRRPEGGGTTPRPKEQTEAKKAEPPRKPSKEDRKREKTAMQRVQDSLDLLYPTLRKDRYTIAVFLPLYLDVPGKDRKQKAASDLALEYYKGLRVAADTMKICGLNLDVRIYDSENPRLTFMGLQDSLRRVDADLIIGPVLDSRLTYMDSLSKVLQINRLSPLQVEKKIQNRMYYLETLPSDEVMADTTARYIKKYFPKHKVFLINERTSKSNPIAQAFAAHFRRDSLTVINYEGKLAAPVTEFPFGDSNIVFIPSKNEVFVTSVLSHLRVNTAPIVLFGLSQWQNFKTIEANLWERYNVHMPATYYLDYKSVPMKGFLRSYRKRFREEPGIWAIIGFDELALAGRWLDQHGRYYQKNIWYGDQPMLHTTYRLRYDPQTGGWKNRYVNMLEFSGYSLHPASR